MGEKNMNSSLIDRNLNEDSYEEYVDKIINIFRLSSKQSSILFSVVIKDYEASIKLSIVNTEGEREEFQDVVLNCDISFYNKFLNSLITRINNNCNIVVKDIIPSSEVDLFTFRMITNNNDLFTIDGLNEDDANNMLILVENKEEKKIEVTNNQGKGNLPVFLLIILLIIVAFILIFVFMK